MKARDVLTKLGFEEDWNCPVGELPAYRFDFGNFVLTATELTNRYFQPVICLDGVIATVRCIREVNFEMPLEVESFEQGVAFIVHALGKDFVPQRPTGWLADGAAWVEHLPWMRKKRQYEARPRCEIDREWFRVANKKLRELGAQAGDTDVMEFRFDGSAFWMTMASFSAALPAAGEPWVRAYAVAARRLQSLPQRLLDPVIHVSVADDRLIIGSRAFALIGGLSK